MGGMALQRCSACGFSAKPFRIEKQRLLIGEGVEEVRFFGALLGAAGITNVQLASYGGKKKLDGFLNALTGLSGFEKLDVVAVTRDADDNAEGAFMAVTQALAKAGMTVPGQHGAFSPGTPSTGVFIMPDGQQSGMLETLCLTSVEDDPAMACVGEYLHCVSANTGRVPNNTYKARLHAWLASQTKPDLRLGEAAEAGIWSFENLAFASLKQFIGQLGS